MHLLESILFKSVEETLIGIVEDTAIKKTKLERCKLPMDLLIPDESVILFVLVTTKR